jgi:DNA polymerase III delta prime subunit
MTSADPATLLDLSLASGRVHSAYLLAGPLDAARAAALRFVRGLVCTGAGTKPCEACASCQRSIASNEIAIDGTGKSGPLYRHVGDHADLVWVERGADDTRVRIGQVRAVQQALRLRSHEGGRRAAVIADAEWLNAEAQNALLRLLEEPPPDTSILLVAASASGLLATVRSRCVRVAFPRHEPRLATLEGDARALADRLTAAGALSVPELLDWAEQYRGARADAAEGVTELLATGGLVLHDHVARRIAGGGRDVRAALDAFHALEAARTALATRNANPQMIAERALLAMRGALR